MPVFKAQRPRSITDAVRLLASTKSEPDALDYMQIDRAEADIRHRQALAEKVRQEVEQEAAADRRRRDPAAQDEYAAVTAGTPLEMVRQFRRHINGELVSPEAALTQGAAAGDVGPTVTNAARIGPTPMPSFTPQQSEAVRSALGSVMANVLATGKTNADQMTQAGGNLQRQDVARRIQTAPTIPAANQLAQSINIREQTPFRATQSGLVNEAAGTVTPTDLSRAFIANLDARTGERETKSDLNDARRDATLNPPPRPGGGGARGGGVRETDAQRREREARAERLELENQQARDRNARAKFAQEPRAKKDGLRLGAYDPALKAWRVLDKRGNVIDHYR